MRPCHRSNAALAGGAVLCDPGGPNVARLQILWHREPTGRYAARTRDSTTGIQGGDRQQPRSGRRGGSAHGGAGVQAVGVGQLPAEALQDLQHLRAVRRMDVAGQRPPAERVRACWPCPSPVQFVRDNLQLSDDGLVALDWAVPPHQKRRRTSSHSTVPVLLIIPNSFGKITRNVLKVMYGSLSKCSKQQPVSKTEFERFITLDAQ